MHLIARIFCLLGQHRRSRGRARPTPTGWRSRCRGCGVPMEKIGDEPWRLAVRGEAKAEQ